MKVDILHVKILKVFGGDIMRKRYTNTLQMMCQGNEELSHIIENFVASFPNLLVNKIHAGKEKGVEMPKQEEIKMTNFIR